MTFRMRLSLLQALLATVVLPTLAMAQGPFTAEVLKESPPAAIADAVKADLSPTGYRVLDGKGKAYADIWLRKGTPASAKPAGANGTIQFPVLSEGVLVGALRYGQPGQDFRDQTIPAGVYTIRYGLQPQNGAHLGASPFRDFALLLPVAKDKGLDILAKKPLDEQSSEAAGTSHPAVLMLFAATDSVKADKPGIVEDKEKNTWAVVIPVPLAVKGGGTAQIDVQMVILGAAMP
jgi:hypothetical protein